MSKKKQVPSGTKPSGAKVAVGRPDRSWGGERPVWRLSYIDLEGPFGWSRLQRPLLSDIVGKLKQIEARTWNELVVVSKKQNHAVPVRNMIPEARKRLEGLYQGGLEELVSLRLAGEQRVWVHRVEATAYVIWWDPDHKVCPSKKKHT